MLRRPRSHLTLGRLPIWARLAAPMAGVVNRVLRGPLGGVAKSAAGVDRRRSVPEFAPRTLRRAVRSGRVPGNAPEVVPRHTTRSPDVWIWADTFTDHFLPGNAQAAIRFLEAAGLTVAVIDEEACCGLTWITTGQLDRARTIVERTVATLAPYTETGAPVLGLEPSCLATLRSDAVELTDDPRAAEVAEGVLTLAELVEPARGPRARPDRRPRRRPAALPPRLDPRLGHRRAPAHGAGAEVARVGGCCGLAGNFGMEKGHYDVSVAVAETQLLPAVRARDDAVVLADGLSCRHQLADLAGVPAIHLAELLADRITR